MRNGSLLAWLATGGYQPGHIAWVAFRMSVIGPLWGCACAVASLLFLDLNAHKDRDANVEATVTVAMPYLVFYGAETAFGDKDQLSGVLAVVAFGLTFASPWGRAHIDPHAEHFLHTFWGSIGHQVRGAAACRVGRRSSRGADGSPSLFLPFWRWNPEERRKFGIGGIDVTICAASVCFLPSSAAPSSSGVLWRLLLSSGQHRHLRDLWADDRPAN